jgi:hypothetical protein
MATRNCSPSRPISKPPVEFITWTIGRSGLDFTTQIRKSGAGCSKARGGLRYVASGGTAQALPAVRNAWKGRPEGGTALTVMWLERTVTLRKWWRASQRAVNHRSSQPYRAPPPPPVTTYLMPPSRLDTE